MRESLQWTVLEAQFPDVIPTLFIGSNLVPKIIDFSVFCGFPESQSHGPSARFDLHRSPFHEISCRFSLESMDMVGYAIGSKDWLSRVAHTRLGEIRPLPLLCTPRRVCKQPGSAAWSVSHRCVQGTLPVPFGL